MQTDEEFQIDINGLIMKVTSHLINGDEVFGDYIRVDHVGLIFCHTSV